ncbi:DNA-binding transcriptional regulator YhcF, GntR family [Lachnospiraceae bacterium RM5]|nr:DNA-binding transcriptional regulator YhcF, GntR family [Lachnospiraceae bacterium RM5]
MWIAIDFNSDTSIYMQLRNQIIEGIATDVLKEGDSLPSVRQMAEELGINMHTVNKAYTVLKNEGLLKLDRRHGAIIAIDIDRLAALRETKYELQIILVKAICKNISEEEVHEMVREIYNTYVD